MTPEVLSELERRRLKKIESRLQEFSFPPQVIVENTSYCNLRCIHCCHKEMIRPQRHMERWLWNKIVEEIGRESPECEVWPTFYGEALILGKDNELWNRLDYAAGAGCRNLVLNSNGTLLDRWENMKKILNSPLKRFILSLDGYSSETFELIRKGADREKVYAQVEELLLQKAQMGKIYPVIICQFSAMNQNKHEMNEFVAHWKKLGAEVKVRSMLEWTASGSIRSDSISHDTNFRIACPWANNTMAILQNGDVTACAVDYEGRFKLGDAKKQTLKEIWQNAGRKFRAIHKEGSWDALPEVCKSCADWQAVGALYEEEKVPGTRPFWVEM